MIEHLDEEGKPCERHAPAEDKLLAYAAVGTRVSGFHHDVASKLQSFVMALDEISELIGEHECDLRTATDTAQSAVHQLHSLLKLNRALVRPPQLAQVMLPELLQRAAERHAVKLRGDVPAIEVNVALPSMTHALSLLLDMLASPPAQGRLVQVDASVTGECVSVTLTGSVETTHANDNELITIAAFMIAREGGRLRCGAKRFVVELALGQASDVART